MNLRIFALLLAIMPGISDAAVRSEAARVGMQRAGGAGVRAPTMVKNLKKSDTKSTKTSKTSQPKKAEVVEEEYEEEYSEEYEEEYDDTDVEYSDDEEYVEEEVEEEVEEKPAPKSANCRDAYRECMDEFCLLDESEGYRCACSSNINKSKSLIQEIQKIQEEADKLYTEGVEREQLGAKARLVFGESEAAQKSSRASGLSFAEWLNSDSSDDEDELDADDMIGDGLYSMAAEFCASELEACGAKAEMEEMLYTRQITADCKAFSSYLTEQKTNAQANKRTAEAAVRQARLSMLDTTNKYNRGECLLAYRACIADKGGCGANFENCLDADLLGRRANACENVLDQCMSVRNIVLEDWEAESEAILVDAAKYADKYRRQTCFAQVQVCLEDGCSTGSNPACLTNVNVAAGVCPIIDECNDIIPGFKDSVNDKLGFLRTQFCQNDIDSCLRDKCGENFTAPECVGKRVDEIVALCPQNMFPSCKNETQFDIIVSAAVLQMDYQMMQGCINYFSDQLGKVCGTDMACLPSDDLVASLTEVPETTEELQKLRMTVVDNSKAAVADFFKDFEADKTVAACQDAEKPEGKASLGQNIFNSAKIIAEISAENRALRDLETKIAELSRKQDLKKAEENCYNTYKVETPDDEAENKNYSYIRSVSFEPSLRNCHVCRMQQVCETGGETKGSAALKAAAGGLTAGASAGTMVSPGWGTAIGGIVGAVGAGVMGANAAGEQEFCQQIESCEDINM
ncbi:MAG: hypothetical protein IJE79_03940 [Alphaproteobacteria bacterium]|nr:hypothetical protein [Alphaproteobacteria bacterium]